MISSSFVGPFSFVFARWAAECPLGEPNIFQKSTGFLGLEGNGSKIAVLGVALNHDVLWSRRDQLPKIQDDCQGSVYFAEIMVTKC